MVSQVSPSIPDRLPLDNARVADRLDAVAIGLEEREANPFRVRAYRNAAAALRSLDRPVSELLKEEGPDGLERIPSIGSRLSRVIELLTFTGHFPLLDEIEGQNRPEELLATVGGVGPGLARRIHDTLGVNTLEELEIAANDGRLAKVPGLGPKRLRVIREVLSARLQRRSTLSSARQEASPPPVEDLLEVDRLYREKAESGLLHRIAPRRFNPAGEAWLPVLRVKRGGRRYRALFSNTALAHELEKTRDWVVIYYSDGTHGQCTVVTAGSGPLRGKRVIRGREAECGQYYAKKEEAVASEKPE